VIDIYAYGIMLFEVTEKRRHEFRDGVRQPRDIRLEVVNARPCAARNTHGAVLGTNVETRPQFTEIARLLEQEFYWLDGTEPTAFAEYIAGLDAEEAKFAVEQDVINKIGRLPEVYELFKKVGPTAPFKGPMLQTLGRITSTGQGLNEGVMSFLSFDLEDDVQLSAPAAQCE
jgi:hypothetical protein